MCLIAGAEFFKNHHAPPRRKDAHTFAAGNEHAAELAYWMDTSDPDPENWWPITSHLIWHRDARERHTT